MGQVSRRTDGGLVTEVFGRHVNRAARIQAIAEPGHVLVSYSVYDFSVGWLRSQGVEWKSLGQTSLKGFREAVSIHEPMLSAAIAGDQPSPDPTSPKYQESLSLAGHPGPPGDPPLGLPDTTTMTLGLVEPEGFADVPPGGVPPWEDPLAHYQEKLQTKVARVERSWLRRLRTRSGRRAPAPTLLWVDDHPENNRSLRALMENAGCAVEIALDTERAMQRVREGPLDLIVTDMGRGSDPTAGLALLSQLEDVRCPTVVFASPTAVLQHQQEARSLGAVECTAGTVQLLRAVTACIRR